MDLRRCNVLKKRLSIMLICALLIMSVGSIHGAQYGTNFKYKDAKGMKEDGWAISNEKAVSFRTNGIVLDGSQGATVITYVEGIPEGVTDFRVGATGAWLGGGHSLINVQVNLQKHQYVFALDGASSKYVLLRDQVKVLSVAGYSEAANAVNAIYLEKTGPSVIISCNSKVIGTYEEKDPSPVSTVAIASAPNAATLYTWAGAFIPEASVAGGPNGDENTPIDAATEEPTEEPIDEPTEVPIDEASWENYNYADDSSVENTIDLDQWIQENPSDDVDPETFSDDEQIPPPGKPEPSTQPPSITHPIDIVINPCTFVINTGTPETDYGAIAEAGHYILNGVCQTPYVHVSDATMHEYCLQEQALYDAGLVAPETHSADYLPFGGNTPSYYVNMSTHISGDFSSVATAQTAVGIFHAEITDANGQIVFQSTITAVSSEGHSIDYFHCQLAQNMNTFLQGVIGK